MYIHYMENFQISMSKATLQTENELLHLIPGGILCIADRQTDRQTDTNKHTYARTHKVKSTAIAAQQTSTGRPVSHSGA